jgi:hypothetical protein
VYRVARVQRLRAGFFAFIAPPNFAQKNRDFGKKLGSASFDRFDGTTLLANDLLFVRPGLQRGVL